MSTVQLPATAVVAAAALAAVPADYQRALVRYAIVDRPHDGGGTVRHLYVSPEALAAVRDSATLPQGTVIIKEQYLATRGPDGQLLHDAESRLISGELEAIAIRAKLRVGEMSAGEQVPEEIRNGDWVYATFDPITGSRQGFDRILCHACHVRADAWDYVFTLPELRTAVEQGSPAHSSCDRPGRQPCQTPDS